jgi:hypothetical protein
MVSYNQNRQNECTEDTVNAAEKLKSEAIRGANRVPELQRLARAWLIWDKTFKRPKRTAAKALEPLTTVSVRNHSHMLEREIRDAFAQAIRENAEYDNPESETADTNRRVRTLFSSALQTDASPAVFDRAMRAAKNVEESEVSSRDESDSARRRFAANVSEMQDGKG